MLFMPLAEIGGTISNKSQMTHLQNHPCITCIKCILNCCAFWQYSGHYCAEDLWDFMSKTTFLWHSRNGCRLVQAWFNKWKMNSRNRIFKCYSGFFPLFGYIKTQNTQRVNSAGCLRSYHTNYFMFISSYVYLMDPANLCGHPHGQNRAWCIATSVVTCGMVSEAKASVMAACNSVLVL
jgi:hypothetical protein